jgi:hypothetical protein
MKNDRASVVSKKGMEFSGVQRLGHMGNQKIFWRIFYHLKESKLSLLLVGKSTSIAHNSSRFWKQVPQAMHDGLDPHIELFGKHSGQKIGHIRSYSFEDFFFKFNNEKGCLVLKYDT